jgi:hypothetical protein
LSVRAFESNHLQRNALKPFSSIVYEMATGKRAFQRKTAVETLSAILKEEPKPIAAIPGRSPGKAEVRPAHYPTPLTPWKGGAAKLHGSLAE